MSTVYIYGLCDPRTNEIKYVGKAYHPQSRLATHISSAPTKEDKNGKWVFELSNASEKPYMIILDIVPIKEGVAAEKYWIDYISQRQELLNEATPGGGNSPKFMLDDINYIIVNGRSHIYKDNLTACNMRVFGAELLDYKPVKPRLCWLCNRFYKKFPLRPYPVGTVIYVDKLGSYQAAPPLKSLD